MKISPFIRSRMCYWGVVGGTVLAFEKSFLLPVSSFSVRLSLGLYFIESSSMPVTYNILHGAGDGRHPYSPYGICLSVNTEINIATGFYCSSETFCCRYEFDDWDLYGWKRRWKCFQLFLAPTVVRAVSEKCQVCHCTMTEFRLAWVQWCANAEVFQNPTPLISGLRHAHYFQDTLKISSGFDHQQFN